jgi:hypothetical protein
MQTAAERVVIAACALGPSWYDPETETSPFLTALAEVRLECKRSDIAIAWTQSPRKRSTEPP